MSPKHTNGITLSVVIFLLLSALTDISYIQVVSGQNQWEQLFGPLLPHISIFDNGTIFPTILPIERLGNLYCLTGDIFNYGISINCDNIVFDGRNFSIKSNRSLAGEALSISAHNVTIQNFVIDTVPVAVSLYGGSGVMGEKTDIKIFNNTIRNCNTAINCWGPSANYFEQNVLENNKIAIKIKGEYYSNGQYFSRGYSCLNIVERNVIKNNDEGLHIEDASQTTIRFNLIEQNRYGALLNDGEGTLFAVNEFAANTYGIHIIAPSSNNQFYRNNFVNNSEAVTLQGQEQLNYWDDGSKGNYWSDYNGTSVYKIDGNNIDHYPLSQPVVINSGTPPEIDDATQNPIQIQTILVVAIVTIMAAVVATLLLYRRHRKTTYLK
jgi:parallel beta-helix repeat protein